jgi:hypothetical protein
MASKYSLGVSLENNNPKIKFKTSFQKEKNANRISVNIFFLNFFKNV